MAWLGICALMLAQGGAGQPPPAIVNTGVPMHIAFECRKQDTDAAGLDCSSAAPCPVYLELNGLDGAGGRIVAAGDFHTESATLASVFLQSADGGRTWTEPFERMSLSTLDRVQFADTSHAWVAGWSGNTLSRNPFFLGTTDGGKSWTKLPVFEDETLASIDQFRFDSAEDGYLLLTMGNGMKHQLFQTHTGASSWELIRESDDPVPFPRGGSAALTNWRLSAGRDSGAYSVERAEGDAWKVVAQFQIQAGSCTE